MKTITREHFTFSFSSAHPEALRVDPDETVVFQTRDGADGQILTGDENMRQLDTERGNPATGPLFVNGTEPGDTLVVEVQDIRLAGRGYLAVIAGVGLLKDGMNDHVRMIDVKGGWIHFSPNLLIPTCPMIGTIGTAPAEGEIRTWHPGPHGGNMDNIEVGVGATLYLPVYVPGALLSVGDVHANQGDGELMGSTLEIEAEVTLRLSLIKGRCWERPWLETSSAWVTCADAPSLADAIRLATRDMVHLLGEKMGLPPEEAYMLVSLTGGAQICQACEGVMNATVRVTIPKF